MDEGDKLQQLADFMTTQNSLLMEKIGPFLLRNAWLAVAPAIEGIISGGQQSPPSVVVRLESGEMAVMALDVEFAPGMRGQIVSAAISQYFEQTSARIVGGAVFSEAYLIMSETEDIDWEGLGKGELPDSQEVVLCALFDGLSGTPSAGFAPIVRDGASPYLGEWAELQKSVSSSFCGDLIQGLALSVTSAHVASIARDYQMAQEDPTKMV